MVFFESKKVKKFQNCNNNDDENLLINCLSTYKYIIVSMIYFNFAFMYIRMKVVVTLTDKFITFLVFRLTIIQIWTFINQPIVNKSTTLILVKKIKLLN